MSVLRGRTEPLSIYGIAGLLLFFVGCAALVVAVAVDIVWLVVLWAVAWVGALVMAVVGSVKSV